MNLIRRFEQLSIHAQIVTIVVSLVLTASGLVCWFALESTKTVLRQEAIRAVGSAASVRRDLLLGQIGGRKARSLSILQMSQGICAKAPKLSPCLQGVFEHFSHANKAVALQFQPTKGPGIQLGLPTQNFNTIPLPNEDQSARFGRGQDGQIYYRVRSHSDLGEIHVEFPVSDLAGVFAKHDDLGTTGVSFLADEKGYPLTLVNAGTKPIEALPMRKCLAGENGEMQEHEYTGVPLIHGYRVLPEIGGGCVMAHEDEDEAFAKSSRLTRNVLSITFGTMVLALILALLAARLITRPIQRLAEHAGSVQKGDFDQTIQIEGPAEVRTFARAFSGMAQTLIQEIQMRQSLQLESDRQKAQFEAIFNSISDGVVFVDVNERIGMANPAFYSLFGFAPGSAEGLPSRALYASDAEYNSRRDLIEQDLGDGKVFGITFQRMDGESFASETMVSTVKDGSGRSIGHIAVVRDIRSVKLAQAQLQQSEERFRRAVLDAPIPIMIRAEDGEVLELNKIWTQMTGYTHAEVPTIGDWTRAAYGDRAEENSLRIARTAHTPHRVDLGEFDIRTKSGGRLLWHFIVAPLGKLPDGRKLVISMASDITERKRAEVELSKAVKSRDEFLATLSHELRTPMNIILGWIDILKSGEYDDALFRQALETLSRNAKIQKDLIDDLLDVSRIISGKFQLTYEPTDFSQIVRETCAALQYRAGEKAQLSEVLIADEQLMVSGDSTKLTQVVTNILHNAFKFTPRGGQIRVELCRSADHAELSIRDSGVGIEPDFLELVFDRLKQEDMGTTRAHAGLGLGLAISRHIVEGHSGTIQALSEGRGKGATFLIRLPLQDQMRSTGATPVVENPAKDPGDYARLRGVRALVVDDSPDILFLLRTWLEQAGMEVFEADSAGEGLAILQKSQPRVLLSDIGMPGQDGYQFIEAVRKLPGVLGRIPAAALTAYAREEERARAITAGFQSHIAKPTNKDAVLQVVQYLVDGLS